MKEDTPIGVEDLQVDEKNENPVQDIQVLIRKIDQQISLKGQSTSPKEVVTYSKLMSLATP